MTDHLIAGGVTTPKGFQAAGVRCGLKEKGLDLALLYSAAPTAAAALFTSNLIQAAPVRVSKRNVQCGRGRAVVINSGNANACTGEQGERDVEETLTLVAQGLHIGREEVLVASTGIIGKPLAMDKLRSGLAEALSSLKEDGGDAAAHAIMTTDTTAKQVAVTFQLAGHQACIGAMAKGSGMINPNLATMLCCLTTDAAVSSAMLDRSLRLAVDDSLNSLTVDGEMSTNDCVLLLANGQCGNPLIDAAGPDFSAFTQALRTVLQAIARAIAMDGEGATKLLLVQVANARDPEQARRAAKAVANSLLVKTALFGRDPNWGRVLSAVGGSGAELRPTHIAVSFAGIPVLAQGHPVPFDPAAMKAALAEKEIVLSVDLATGSADARVFSCDLSYEYVKINAEYHT